MDEQKETAEVSAETTGAKTKAPTKKEKAVPFEQAPADGIYIVKIGAKKEFIKGEEVIRTEEATIECGKKWLVVRLKAPVSNLISNRKWECKGFYEASDIKRSKLIPVEF